MHTRFKQFSENLWLTRDPWKYGEYLRILPSKTRNKYALKWKLGTLCITSQQDRQDMAYAEKLLGIKKTNFK